MSVYVQVRPLSSGGEGPLAAKQLTGTGVGAAQLGQVVGSSHVAPLRHLTFPSPAVRV